MPPGVKVLFACVHNARRSQMAAALFNAAADPAKARAMSAGSEPARHVHPEVVQVMRELGIDVAHVVPMRLTEDIARQATLLVTMGCGETCPVVPGLRREDWDLPDPKGQPLAVVRAIRDEVRRRVDELVGRQRWGCTRSRAWPRKGNATEPAAVREGRRRPHATRHRLRSD